MDSLRERADALSSVCIAMFGASQPVFPTVTWADSFSMEVILYGLVEAELKRRRTVGMTVQQVSHFAHTVMNRRAREEKEKNKCRNPLCQEGYSAALDDLEIAQEIKRRAEA